MEPFTLTADDEREMEETLDEVLTQAAEEAKTAPRSPKQCFTIKMPLQLYFRFKKACMQRDVTMTMVVVVLVRKILPKLESRRAA